jgi:large subunit ribosomal protein L9
MPAVLQVVLQSNVANVGVSGELVKVRPGFARNFLIPRGFAVPATESAVNRIAHEKGVALAKYEKSKKESKAIADKLSSLVIKIARTVGDDGKLFGSVSTKEIESAVQAQGIDFDRKKMHLKEPIKTLGTFEIPVKLVGEVTATLKVEVVKK